MSIIDTEASPYTEASPWAVPSPDLQSKPWAIVVRVYAHRPDVTAADKIMHEHVEVGTHGQRAAFKDWVDMNQYKLSRMMIHDNVTRVTIIGTDAPGNMLLGIRTIKAPVLQMPLEF